MQSLALTYSAPPEVVNRLPTAAQRPETASGRGRAAHMTSAPAGLPRRGRALLIVVEILTVCAWKENRSLI